MRSSREERLGDQVVAFRIRWGIHSARNSGLLLVFLLANVLTVSAATQYTVTPLTLGGTSVAEAINASGQVVGHSIAPDGSYHAFLYSNGKMTDLGVFGSASDGSASGAYGPTASGQGINASGQIVVDYGPTGVDTVGSIGVVLPPSIPNNQAFLYSNGTVTRLSPPVGGSAFFGAFAINASGQIAGAGAVVSPVNGDPHFYARPYLRTNGLTTYLGALSLNKANVDNPVVGYGYAAAMNDSGQVVGAVVALNSVSEYHNQAFLNTGAAMTILGDLGGGESYATGVDSGGRVVGFSATSNGFTHPFLYSAGKMVDLSPQGINIGGSATFKATGINDAGQIIGSTGAGVVAYVYNGGVWTDLNTLISPGSGWILENPIAINAQGQIAGMGNFNGGTVAFLLTPVAVPGGGPIITSLSPPSSTVGSSSLVVTISGTGFASGEFAQFTVSGKTTNLVSQSLSSTSITAQIPASLLASVGTAQIAVASSTGNLSNTVTFAINPIGVSPAIASGGVVPVYSSVTTIQPGEWVSIYGTNLANAPATWNGDFPISLGGTSVTINGKAAYLWFVSPTQINLQAPSDLTTGAVPVVISTTSGAFSSTVTLSQFAPSFSLLDAKHVTGIILRSNGSGAYGGGSYDIIGPTGSSLGYPTVAARAGDIVELFAVGLGPTNPTVLPGQVFSSAAATTNSVNVVINKVNVLPTFSGLSSAGLYQINLVIPAGLGAGDVSLTASVGGSQTPSGIVISLQ